MGYRLLKSVISLSTAMAVAFAPIAEAEVNSAAGTAAKLETAPKGPHGSTQLNFTVEVVEPGQELKTVETAVKKDPNATLTIVSSGPINAIHPQLLNLQHRVISYEQVTYKAEAAKIPESPPSAPAKTSKAKALFVTVRAAGSFAAAYYLLGRDYAGVPEMLMNADFLGAVQPLLAGDPSVTAKAFGLAMIFSGYQIMYTSSWQKYLLSAGEMGRTAWAKVAKMVGRSIADGRVSDKFGRTLGAYAFNLLTTTTILATLGGVEAINHMQTTQGMLQVGTLAAVASWDAVLDVFLGRQVEIGQMSQTRYEKFVQYRLTYGPWLEGPAIALSGTAVGFASASLLAAVGTIGLIMTFAFEPAKEIFDRRRKLASEGEESKATLWQKVKAKLQRKQAVENLSCAAILS